MQIIILGMHRSGTSMVTRLINMLGAYVGPERMMLEYRVKKLMSSNAKGHWERGDVLDINEAIFREHNTRWDKPVPLPSSAQSLENAYGHITLSEATRQAIKLCLYGMDGHRPWVMKDPRLCLTLPYWLPHMEMPLVIFVTRNPAQIALSLNTRNGIAPDTAMALWEYYIASALNASLHIPRLFVDYQDVLERPQISLEGTFRWLASQGVRKLDMPGHKEISAFVDPNLHQATSSERHIPFTNSNQQQLWHIVKGTLPQVGYVSCSDASTQRLTS